MSIIVWQIVEGAIGTRNGVASAFKSRLEYERGSQMTWLPRRYGSAVSKVALRRACVTLQLQGSSTQRALQSLIIFKCLTMTSKLLWWHMWRDGWQRERVRLTRSPINHYCLLIPQVDFITILTRLGEVINAIPLTSWWDVEEMINYNKCAYVSLVHMGATLVPSLPPHSSSWYTCLQVIPEILTAKMAKYPIPYVTQRAWIANQKSTNVP